MKYQLIFCLLGILFFTYCNPTKKIVVDKEKNKAEAMAFSLSIIETYFAEDCDVFINLLSDTIFVMDGDGIFRKEDLPKNNICRSIKNAIKEENKTMEDYLDTYIIELLEPSEIEMKFDIKLPEYYERKVGDFFFVGGELKPNKNKADGFIWDDMFVFMIRKEKGNWRVKGGSG